MEPNGVAATAGTDEVIEPDHATAHFVALFLLGFVLFSPWLLRVFDAPGAEVFGIPLLFVYLFVSWVVLIALTAWLSRRIGDLAAPVPPQPEALSDGG